MSDSKSNKMLVLGNGFLGGAFARHGATVWDRDEFEYPVPESLNELESTLREGTYTTVVNCIGVSDTRFCEDPSNWEIGRAHV